MRKALALLGLLPVSLFAQAPCAAPVTQKIVPCGQTADAPSDVVATIDGSSIRIADLDEATRKKIEGLDAAIAAAREKAMRQEIDDQLLAAEAKRRGVPIGSLIHREIILKTARPSEQDVNAEMASHPNKYKNGSKDAEWAAGTLFDERLAAREKEFVAAIEKKRRAIKHAPGLLVGTAIADERISAMEAQKAAVERVIHERLLAAEAARRGMSAEELTRAEVAARVTAATDAEVRAEWEKFKRFYGDDFEKARPAVTASVQQDKTAALEKAFDAQLREGHAIRLMFDVPRRPAQNVVTEAAPSRGSRNAGVTVVEFGDFQCPPCGFMWGVVDEALRPYGDRVRYVFRQMPLSMHAHAWKAAEAGLAAHAQGKFFAYAQILFANQNALDVASLKKYAADAGLDAKRFNEDLDSGRFAADVAADRRAGQRAGVVGTPMFYINGVRGGDDVYSVEGMRAAIDAAAAQARR